MRMEWDEDKNRLNIRKHGFDFADARPIFEGLMLSKLDTRHEYGEDRWVGIGLLYQRTVVVAYTEQVGDVI